MENLKKLLGSAYHEGITVEEINTFLAEKKFVNLKDGGYVDESKYTTLKEKYETLEKAHNEFKESVKDYETLKKDNETYKAEKETSALKSTLSKYGINEKFFKYVKGDIDAKELVIGDKDEDNKKAVESYLEAHPEFKETKTAEKPQIKIATGLGEPQVNKDSIVEKHKTINDAIREKAGIKAE